MTKTDLKRPFVDIDAWRYNVIKQLTEGETNLDDEEGLARLAHALHDFRIRDAVCRDVANSKGDPNGIGAMILKHIVLSAADSVPFKERAGAYVVAAVCTAVIGDESRARMYADMALRSDANHFVRLLVDTYTIGPDDLTDVVRWLFSGLPADECRTQYLREMLSRKGERAS